MQDRLRFSKTFDPPLGSQSGPCYPDMFHRCDTRLSCWARKGEKRIRGAEARVARVVVEVDGRGGEGRSSVVWRGVAAWCDEKRDGVFVERRNTLTMAGSLHQ